MHTNSCVRSTSGTGIRNWCPTSSAPPSCGATGRHWWLNTGCGAHGADEIADAEHRAQVVNNRVADVDGQPHRCRAAREFRRCDDRPLVKGFRPRDFGPAARRAPHGPAQRSGSSRISSSATAFGQLWPWLSTSARSALIEITWPSRCSTTTPHIASQIGQLRWCKLRCRPSPRSPLRGRAARQRLRRRAGKAECAEQHQQSRRDRATAVTPLFFFGPQVLLPVTVLANGAVVEQRALAALSAAFAPMPTNVAWRRPAAAGRSGHSLPSLLKLESFVKSNPSREIEKIVPKLVAVPLVVGASAERRSVQLAVGKARQFGRPDARRRRRLKWWSTVNVVPSGDIANSVPLPEVPPWVAAPYRNPSPPSIRPAPGIAPSAFSSKPVVASGRRGRERVHQLETGAVEVDAENRAAAVDAAGRCACRRTSRPLPATSGEPGDMPSALLIRPRPPDRRPPSNPRHRRNPVSV